MERETPKIPYYIAIRKLKEKAKIASNFGKMSDKDLSSYIATRQRYQDIVRHKLLTSPMLTRIFLGMTFMGVVLRDPIIFYTGLAETIISINIQLGSGFARIMIAKSLPIAQNEALKRGFEIEGHNLVKIAPSQVSEETN